MLSAGSQLASKPSSERRWLLRFVQDRRWRSPPSGLTATRFCPAAAAAGGLQRLGRQLCVLGTGGRVRAQASTGSGRGPSCRLRGKGGGSCLQGRKRQGPSALLPSQCRKQATPPLPRLQLRLHAPPWPLRLR